MIFIFIGLNLSDTIENSTQYILFWVVYSLVTMSFLNVFLLSYFWSIIRKKTGPPGIRGPKGNFGNRGYLGKCKMNSSNAICMTEINLMLNDLFQKEDKQKIDNKRLNINFNKNNDVVTEKPKSIITKDNLLINGFMRRKISTICNSIQFDILNETLVTEGKGPKYLIDYLKNIIKDWFYLIYNQNSNWFIDPDATQRYDWKSKNPFNEIKKYDIYYWGDTRRFKPLKNNICKSGIQENNELPSSQNTSRLKMIITNDYQEIYDDIGSGSSNALKIYRPNVHKYNDVDYYPMGDIANADLLKNRDRLEKKNNSLTIIGDLEYEKSPETNNGPDKETILISGDIRDPVDYELMWRDQKNSSNGPGRIWKPVAPQGYTCMGDVATNYYPPNHPDRRQFLKHNKEINMKCVPSDCVEPLDEVDIVNNEKLIWNVDRNNNADIVFNGNIYALGNDNKAKGSNIYNLFRTNDFSYLKKNGKVITKKGDKYYSIKQSCLNNARQKTKSVETQFENIGIGWYGAPANTNPKYSVFHFMGLVPEGVIENIYTTYKYYIVHYGGVDLNCYNIYVFNEKTAEYDKAFEIDKDNSYVYPKKIQKNNKKQQWRIKKKDKHYYLVSVYNERLLSANFDSNDPPLITVDKSMLNYSSNDGMYFTFTPAFGNKPNE